MVDYKASCTHGARESSRVSNWSWRGSEGLCNVKAKVGVGANQKFCRRKEGIMKKIVIPVGFMKCLFSLS